MTAYAVRVAVGTCLSVGDRLRGPAQASIIARQFRRRFTLRGAHSVGPRTHTYLAATHSYISTGGTAAVKTRGGPVLYLPNEVTGGYADS